MVGTAQNPPRRRTWPWIVLSAVLLTLTIGVLAGLSWGTPSAPGQSAFPPVATLLPGRAATAAEVEQRLGIRVRFIAVTAAGGLVELRYEVVDPEKAAPLLERSGRPVLVAEDSGAVLTMHVRPAQDRFLAGRTYSFLFANTRSVIRPGSLVTVAIGDLRLEHVQAQ